MDLRNRPLDIGWLRDFLVLAESGNFSQSAKDRSIAQPALSRHIRALEEWVGTDLFDRSTHPASLTEAGRQFRPMVEDLLEDIELARQKALAAHGASTSVLRLAAPHALTLGFFPGWLSSLEGLVRVGPIQMISDNYRACEDLLLRHQVHFLLCHGHPGVRTSAVDSGFTFQVLREDVLVPVSAPDPKGQPRFRLSGGQPGSEPLLMYDAQSGLGSILNSRLEGLIDIHSSNVVFTSHHATLLKTMAVGGRGIAWLPRSLVKNEVAEGSLLELTDCGREIPLEIRLFRQKGELPAVARAIWDSAGKVDEPGAPVR